MDLIEPSAKHDINGVLKINCLPCSRYPMTNKQQLNTEIKITKYSNNFSFFFKSLLFLRYYDGDDEADYYDYYCIVDISMFKLN